MLVLVLGATGMLGYDITKALAHKGIPHISTSKLHLDITDQLAVWRVCKNLKVSHVINCAAYTNVPLAETQEDKALHLNAKVLENLASVCNNYSIPIIHFSTDYVFNGVKATSYSEDDETNPINIYGKTKLEGELVLKNTSKDYTIFRLQWLYGANGNNFISKILESYGTHGHVKVVTDQFGSPCSTIFIAKTVVDIISNQGRIENGVYHLTHDDYCSWFDFANAIFELANIPSDVVPITHNSYPAKVQRPENSVMNNEKLKLAIGLSTLGDWKSDLRNYFIVNRDAYKFLWK